MNVEQAKLLLIHSSGEYRQSICDTTATMVLATSLLTPEDLPDTPGLNGSIIGTSDILTPSSTHSGETSPTLNDNEDLAEIMPSSQKKKKKKKPKKSAKAKEAALKAKTPAPSDLDGRPPVLCISRNKHWRYISSYHVCSTSCVMRLMFDEHEGSLAPTPS